MSATLREFLESVGVPAISGAVGTVLGPTVGAMPGVTYAALKVIEVGWNEKQKDDIAAGRKKNGNCPHVLLAQCSPGLYGESEPGQCGDREVTFKKGKRFQYSDINAIFWHPAVEFLPAGNPINVWIGSDEKIPESSKGTSIGTGVPSIMYGQPTCAFCGDDSQKIYELRSRYLKSK